MTYDLSEFGQNAWLIEEKYRQFREDPESVGPDWREFFEDYARKQPDRARDTGAAVDGGVEAGTDEELVPLRGADGTIARRMEESLAVPTATSVRTVPAKLLEINRAIVNAHRSRNGLSKISFTHMIAWAIVRGLGRMPGMLVTYRNADGKGFAVRHKHVNLGLAVDVKRKDGSRTLLVPSVKNADTLDFAGFVEAYDDLVRRATAGALKPDDFTGTLVTITNPGTLGTDLSVPRLMDGQAAIVGVGAIDYPPEYAGADPRTLADIGVGKVLTLTSTYDHRVIQGAESGEFLGVIERLLLGEDGFYGDLFRSLGVRSVPTQWGTDDNPAHDSPEGDERLLRIQALINLYRVRGHLIAQLDPLESEPPAMHSELDPTSYGFTIWDLDRRFPTGGLAGTHTATLREILNVLRDAYCRTATVEYMHIQDPDQKEWIQQRVEGVSHALEKEDRERILRKLNQAEAFERFLHRTYLGHKRFSLEGAETLIPMLDAVLDGAADGNTIEEVVIGMAHRGRLNVLANTIGKSYQQIFREFEGDIDPSLPQGSGDVKYHIGASGAHTGRTGREIAVEVASNPSHLEAVDPVVEGMVRAKQDALNRGTEYPVLPVLIHGDAAFAGQGVVQETLNLSQLSGYRTGGTVHLIVNNQLGYTTGPSYGRSSTYPSDVARMIQAPIFHVNGDDPEACVRVARLAFEFRQTFHKDVVVDMWCYRRWGHNETDDPSITQPLMYERIDDHRSVRKLYTESLVRRGDLTMEEAESWLEDFRRSLENAFERTKAAPERAPGVEWKRPVAIRGEEPIETGVDAERLTAVGRAIGSAPEPFRLHKLIQTVVKRRAAALDEDAVDWPTAEELAWGTLLLDGVTVRLSGQDSRRGTFSQRHSVFVDQLTGEEWTPLAHLADAQGKFFAYDSLLSEFAVLGFEYGYSVANPLALVMWEAQFGDFTNGAQAIVDGFISAAEDKWAQTSGVVLLLPHGYEGQGPEHSSARLERFLQLGAEDNLQVVYPSTPAQYFHVLRRQALRAVRKPLVVMTPKAAMRDRAMRSPAAEFREGHFHEVLGDPTPPAHARRVLLCTGKIFYDLAKHRAEQNIDDVAIVRIEQLYPFPDAAVRAAVELYPDADAIWVQEEPENMGAARHVLWHCARDLDLDVTLVAREESASPATGSLKVHQHEQALLLDAAFAPAPR